MKTPAFLVAFCVASATSSAIATTFSPQLNPDGSYEEVDFFNLSVPGSYNLGLFDSADTGFVMPLYVSSGDAVSFTPSAPGSGPFVATNETSLLTLGLGDTPEFILGIYDGSTWFGDSNATPLDANGSAFSVSFAPAPGAVLSVDLVLASVPVPAAAWLFCTGFVGLVLVSRRKGGTG